MRKLRRISALLIIALCLLMSLSFSKNRTVTVKGSLAMYGNEPHTYLGLTTSDKDFYVVMTEDKDLYKELCDHQLETIEITGILNTKNTPEKIIYAQSYEVLEEKKK